MELKLFNPDFEINGNYDANALARAETERLREGSAFNAETDCPYDRTPCRQKLVRINNWTHAVEYLATHRIDNVFITSGDMFYPCPVPELCCIRRARYEGMLKKIKQQEQTR